MCHSKKNELMENCRKTTQTRGTSKTRELGELASNYAIIHCHIFQMFVAGQQSVNITKKGYKILLKGDNFLLGNNCNVCGEDEV